MKPGGSFSELVQELVRERTGLAPERRDAATRDRLVARAMARAGARTETAYLALLRRDPRVFDELVSDLTVPESYFFRDPPHYALLRNEVLPMLRAANEPDHVLEVWSAGCAGGEEPYSLAILLEQEGLEGRSHVLGTDISRRALARAERAIYSRWSLRATEERDVARYFVATEDGFELSSRIRARVRLMHHSLSAPTYPRPASRVHGFDLILCRNVLIYFDPKATSATAQRLARSLGDNGLLLMGPSDPLLAIEATCDVIPTPCGILYRRRTGAPRRSSRPSPARPSAASSATSSTQTPSVSFAAEAPDSAVHTRPTQAARRARTAASARPPAAVPALTPAESVRALVREKGARPGEVLCRELAVEHPLDAELHFVHASLLVDLGLDEAAEAALRRVLYLDRTLLQAQMLSAALAERRSAFVEAARLYEQIASASGREPGDAPVPLGDGMTFGALEALATQRARALRKRGARP